MFDHAAQFFTVSDPSFQTLVDEWVLNEWVAPWDGPVGRVDSDGVFKPAPPEAPRYFGVGGNRMLAQRIAAHWCVIHHFPTRALRTPLPPPSTRGLGATAAASRWARERAWWRTAG